MQANKSTRTPLLLPLVLIVVGVLLLLNNFLLLGDFNALSLLPLLLVAAGALIVLRGDLSSGEKARSFGITRGSVESAVLEISAGEIDVDLRRLQREGRLIAGQFAPASRPDLDVDGTHAHLKLLRWKTPWLAFADWQAALAHDLPWQIYITTSLGQINADLSGLIVQSAVIASGIGDVRVVAPVEAFEPVRVRSAAGSVHIITPEGQPVQIHVRTTRLFKVHVDETRYEQIDTGIYAARDADLSLPPVEITVQGTFGDAYLA